MSGGVGRGRGWLNLKAQNTKSPGSDGNTPPIVNNISPQKYNAQDKRKYSDAPNDYTDLISKIQQLNINDDGIKFNQKIKYIIESWYQDCQNASEVENSFDAIHEASLDDADTATKLVLLIASRTFLSQEIHEQNIRLMFLRKLQDNFEGCVQLQSSNPNWFRNSVQLMGEFFNKARLANGQQFSFMATPLLSYLEMLLESAESLDFRLFTIQLYLNGSSLKQECPEKIAEVLSKVRCMICSDRIYSNECKLWLLLALEMSSNRFALVPADIQKFYQEQLGDHAMACFQGSHGTLTVQTVHNSKNLDSFQSNVNVLQVSTDSSTDAVSPLNSVSSDFGSSVNNYCSSGFQSDSSQASIVSKKDSQSNSIKGGKSGRPILGAGARLYKNRVQNNESSETDKSQSGDSASSNWNRNKGQNNADSGNWQKNKAQKDNTTDSNWRDKDSKRGTDQQQPTQKKDWEKKKTPPKSKKGWEHDDRFETDY